MVQVLETDDFLKQEAERVFKEQERKKKETADLMKVG